MSAIRPVAAHTGNIDYPARQQEGHESKWWWWWGGLTKTGSSSLEISELRVVSNTISLFLITQKSQGAGGVCFGS